MPLLPSPQCREHSEQSRQSLVGTSQDRLVTTPFPGGLHATQVLFLLPLPWTALKKEVSSGEGLLDSGRVCLHLGSGEQPQTFPCPKTGWDVDVVNEPHSRDDAVARVLDCGLLSAE